LIRRVNLLRDWDWGVVIIAVLPVMVLGSFLMNGAVDPFDEGIHFFPGALYRDGLVPYVDFYPLFPPIWTYAQIIIEAVFGPFLLAQRLWFVAQGCATVVICYMLLKRFITSRFISLFAISMVAITGFNPFWLPRWSGARLAVYILFWFLYRYHANGPGEGRNWRLFFLGLFAGMSNLYAFDVGIHLTTAGIFMLAVELPYVVRSGEGYGRAARDLARCSAGFFTPLFFWGVYLAANGSLENYIVTYYYHYIVLMVPISAKILSGNKFVFANEKVIGLLVYGAFLAGGGLYLLLTGWFRDGGRVRTVPLLAMALSFIAGVSTIRAVDGAQYQMFAFIPMLLWVGYGLDRTKLVFLRWRFFSSGSRMANSIKAYVAGTLAVVLSFAVMFTFYTGTAKDRLKALKSNINIYRVVFAGTSWPPGTFSSTPALKGTFDTTLDDIAAYLNSHTNEGESVLAFPMYTEMIPALAGRHSATRYPAPVLVIGSPEGQRAYMEDIKRERPRYLVFFPEARYGGLDPLEPYFKQVYTYLFAHYRPVPGFTDSKAQQIWVRVD